MAKTKGMNWAYLNHLNKEIYTTKQERVAFFSLHIKAPWLNAII